MKVKGVALLIGVFLLAAIYWYCHILQVLPLRPQGIHQWAMCDRASVARNYAEESMNFFKPRTNYTLGGNGVTGIEFPIVNYSVAVLYKLFGFHEWLYRALSLLIISLGLIFGFRLGAIRLQNALFGVGIVLLWMLSPTLNFYMASFIPDTSSLGFILIAWYFLFRHIKSSSSKDIVKFSFFAALAALIKITSLLSICSVLCLIILDYTSYFKNRNDGRALFADKRRLLAGIGTAFLAVFSWYAYSSYLNSKARFPVFTMDIHPIFDREILKELFPIIRDNWLGSYHSAAFLALLAVTALVMLFFYRKVDRLLGSITVLLYGGTICFFMLMLFQFVEHDYYIIALLPAVLFHLLAFCTLLENIFSSRIIKYVVLPILAGLIIYEASYSRKEQLSRYFGPRAEMSADMDFRKFYSIEPFIRKTGIRRQDEVLVVSDPSLNISLYFMNVKGWTMRWPDRQDSLAAPFRNRVPYILLRTAGFKPWDKYRKYFSGEIAEYEGIKIYRPNYDSLAKAQ